MADQFSESSRRYTLAGSEQLLNTRSRIRTSAIKFAGLLIVLTVFGAETVWAESRIPENKDSFSECWPSPGQSTEECGAMELDEGGPQSPAPWPGTRSASWLATDRFAEMAVSGPRLPGHTAGLTSGTLAQTLTLGVQGTSAVEMIAVELVAKGALGKI
jgi:hypothetical protein